MRMLNRRFLGTIAVLCTACSAQSDLAYAPSPVHPQTASRPADPPPPIVQAELPPHRFSIPPHDPRRWITPAAVQLGSLPSLVQSNRCIAAGAVEEGNVRSRPRSAPRPRTPHRPATTPPIARNEPSKDSGAPVGMGNTAGGSDRGFEEQASDAPPPAVTLQGSPRDELKKAKRKATRRADRERRKASRARKRSGRNRRAETPLAPSADASELNPNNPYRQPPAAEPQPQIVAAPTPPAAEGWGQPLYVSNDDSMSLSSAQRIQFAIANVLPLQPSDIRAHELLNWAFGDMRADVDGAYDFAVQGDLHPADRPGLYTMALAVHGRRLGRDERRNAALTVLVDVSGSMKRENRIERVRRGLLRMVRELRRGDVVNLVTFDHRVCPKVSGFVVGRDDLTVLTDAVHKLRPRGNTNLHAGLTHAYTLADRSYQPTYSNRVVVLTDARANRGVTDPRTLSMVTDHFDARRIRLSGVGVGQDFNDALLDQLTEKGRGAYVFLGSDEIVDRIFGDRFISLIETVANDVHFRLHLPPSMRVQRFHGEEASTQRSEVQAVHFFANTSQILLSDVEVWDRQLREQDDVMLEIEYLDPETGELRVEHHPIRVGDAARSRQGLAANARLVVALADELQTISALGEPRGWKPRAGGWNDPRGSSMCREGRQRLQGFESATWRHSAVGVWDDYCRRFAVSSDRPGRKR